MNRIFNFFDRGLSWADLLWRLITFIIIIFGGTTTAILAKASDLFKNSSPLIWVLIGLTTAFILVFIFYIFNLSRKQVAHADYLKSLASPASNINPLLSTFEDKIINLSDLQLPLNEKHKYKHFRRCKIVGPGAIAILGGTYNQTGFRNCGDPIMVPEGTNLTGVIVLEDCTLEDCMIINITIFSLNTPETIQTFFKLNQRVISGKIIVRN